MLYVMGTCFLSPKERQVSTMWQCKQVYVFTTWVIQVYTHKKILGRKGSPAEILQSLYWSFERHPCNFTIQSLGPLISALLCSSLGVNVRVIPWIGQGKPKHPEALGNTPDHLKNNLWRKYSNMTAFILVHLPLGMHRVMPGIFTPAGVWKPGMNFPNIGTLQIQSSCPSGILSRVYFSIECKKE